MKFECFKNMLSLLKCRFYSFIRKLNFECIDCQKIFKNFVKWDFKGLNDLAEKNVSKIYNPFTSGDAIEG